MEGKPLCEKTVAFFKSLPQDKITYWEEEKRPIDESCQQVYAYVPFDEKPVKALSFKTEQYFVNDMEITNFNELGFYWTQDNSKVLVNRDDLGQVLMERNDYQNTKKLPHIQRLEAAL